MKKIITSALSLMMLCSLSSAVAQGSDVQTVAKNKVATMDKVVDLTPEQEQKMLPVYVQETKDARAAAKLKGEERKTALDTKFKNFQAGAKEVLTPEQMKEWQAHMRAQFQKNKKQ